MSKKRVPPLSLKQKLQIIREIEGNVPKKTIREKYKCDLSTVNRIFSNRLSILSVSEKSSNLQQKRQRKGWFDNTEKALALWFDQQREKEHMITSSVLLNKAKEFAINFNEDFKPNSSWLFRWKRRNNITAKKIPDESTNNVKKETGLNYTANFLSNLIQYYDPENIMNADESGLFYKALPPCTLCRADSSTHSSHKSQKSRFTILFICNATGSFRRAYVIGKAKIPRCLKNVEPVPYLSNKKAWMTSQIWSDIMHLLDMEMQDANKKIILFVDNVSCHKAINLRNIKLQVLPSNNTDFIQPLEQGIIHTFEIHYRQIIVKKQLSALALDMPISEFEKSISLLDALYFVKKAWWLVKQETISKYFAKAKLYQTPDTQLEVVENAEFLEIISNQADYIECDEDLDCYGHLTDAEIVEYVKEYQNIDEEELADKTDAEIVNCKQALTALDDLQKYCLYNKIDENLSQIEDAILKQSLRNSK